MAQNDARLHTSIASHACATCRKQKRRCTKELPQCRLCSRLKKPCDYSDDSLTSGSEDVSRLRDRIAELEARLDKRASDLIHDSEDQNSNMLTLSKPLSNISEATTDHDHLSMFFLDCQVFHEIRLTVHKPTPDVPSEIQDLIGNLEDILGVADRHFNETHLWLPIVSRKRMELTLSAPDYEPKADHALLIATMRLLSESPQNTSGFPQSQMYWTVKNYFSMLELYGVMSVQVLQASILIAVYEIAHAIYPAAYLSPSRSARLGQALGFDDRQNTPQMLSMRPGAWAELEEYKRTWWAVMLIDRFVNLGLSGHALATDEPRLNDILPVDDKLWDLGEMSSGQPLYVASPPDLKAGSYTRTCQASNLLGRYISHRNDHSTGGPSRYLEAMQLHRTLLAFSHLLSDEFAQSPVDCGTAMALCYSTMLHLYDPYACHENMRGVQCVEGSEMQTIAIAGLKSVSANVLELADVMYILLQDKLDTISPLMIECLYQGAANYAWLVHETGSIQSINAYRKFVNTLQRLDNRWASAGQYLKILEKTRQTLYENNTMLSVIIS